MYKMFIKILAIITKISLALYRSFTYYLLILAGLTSLLAYATKTEAGEGLQSLLIMIVCLHFVVGGVFVVMSLASEKLKEPLPIRIIGKCIKNLVEEVKIQMQNPPKLEKPKFKKIKPLTPIKSRLEVIDIDEQLKKKSWFRRIWKWYMIEL